MSEKKPTGCFTKIVAAVVLLVAFKMCSKALTGEKDTASPAADPTAAFAPSGAPATPPKSVPLPKLSAVALMQAYTANEVAADNKYKGRQFTITGTVVSISSGVFGPTLMLGSDIDGVLASGIGKDFAASLHKGELVELDCKVTGSTLGSPTIDCVN